MCDIKLQDLVSFSSDSEGNSTSPCKPTTSQRKYLKKSVKSCVSVVSIGDPYAISDRTAVAILSAMLDDISSDFEVADRRERQEKRREANTMSFTRTLH